MENKPEEQTERQGDRAEMRTAFSLQANPDQRKGAFANYFTLMTGKGCFILDSFFMDTPAVKDDNGFVNMQGVMVSRLILNRDSLLDLRDMIDAHLKKEENEQ